MTAATKTGLVLYGVLAAAGLFIHAGLSNPFLLYPWLIGYLYLVFRISFDSYTSREPLNPFPFIVLGVILLNFLVQITGGVRSYLWPLYFLYAVVVAAFSPPRRAYGMVAVILGIESANLLLTARDLSGRWHLYAGFGLSLAAVSAASSHIMKRSHRQTQEARQDREQLIAHAEALDPLTDPHRLESLMNRHTAAVRAARQREISFSGLIDMISEFVPAHTYAVFVRERRDQNEVFVLRAVRSGSPDAVAAVGTELNRDHDRTLIDVCAEQRQRQYLADIADLGTPLSKLGYYRHNARDVAVRSLLVVPVVVEDVTIAVFAVDSEEAGAFSIEDQDTLSYFTPFFIQIIEKIQMALDLKTRADHFGTLHEISADLSSSLRFDELMTTVVPKILKLVPADYAACILTTDHTGPAPLRFAALHGYDQQFVGRLFAIEESAVISQMQGLWRERGITVYYSGDLGDRGRDIQLFPVKEMRKTVRTLYGRLLVSNDTFLGVFFLASLRPDAFTAYHREFLLDTLINQISTVAYNTLLFQRIENMARTDGLTGLLNHRTFMEKLAEKYRELDRVPRPFSILLLDIDKFKAVNDKYGHPVGDLAIKAVAAVMRETVRATDFVARYGGEEFAVGMIETDSRGALHIAERVRASMEKTVVTRVYDGDLRVTLSIGVATFPDDGAERGNLVSLADEALYHAKRTGRNRVSRSLDARKNPVSAQQG